MGFPDSGFRRVDAEMDARIDRELAVEE